MQTLLFNEGKITMPNVNFGEPVSKRAVSVVFLTDDDRLPTSDDVPVNMLSPFDFKRESPTWMHEATYIFYMDPKGNMKILKERRIISR